VKPEFNWNRWICIAVELTLYILASAVLLTFVSYLGVR
jgi:hypothetical protein